MRSFSEKFIFTIFFICLFLGLYRVWGYTMYEVPYGYDPGFFRYAINSALETLPSLPRVSDPYLPYHEPLFPILSVILIFIGYTPDQIVGPFLGFLSVFTSLSLYFLGKQLYGRSFGLLAGSIFLISIVQYQEFWWNYWRNIVGIIFLVTALGLYARRSILLVFMIAGISTIHRASALYLMIILFVLILIEIFRTRKMPWQNIVSLFIGGSIALPLYIGEFSVLTDMIVPLSTTFGSTNMSGTFFTSREFFFLIIPYFIILIPAIYKKFDKHEYDSIFVGFLLGLIWSVFRLFFYNRMLIFFDIFAILLAAYALNFIIANLNKYLSYAILGTFFLVQGGLYIAHANTYISRHSISREEFDIVQNLDILIPKDSTILSTHRFYTPWLLGYSKMRTLAPGMLRDQIWDEKKWNTFYFQAHGEEKCRMIQEYKKIAPKLYVFVGDQQPALDLPATCFHPLLSNTHHPIVYEVIWK